MKANTFPADRTFINFLEQEKHGTDNFQIIGLFSSFKNETVISSVVMNRRKYPDFLL